MCSWASNGFAPWFLNVDNFSFERGIGADLV
jgi:hypothetical protein